ncbi:MAG: hypothetical protein KGY67_00490 [Candidatus Thermoplasmatota archaeon]|nr:hypothetical protein [Candidatus Thermoplasmatota archaeon]
MRYKNEYNIKPVSCWSINDDITVCEGDIAVEKGDMSVGIPSQEVKIVKVFPEGSILVKPKNDESYEESIYMFRFEEELKEQEIDELKFQLDMCIDEYNRVK